jgi:hypothetical protein
VRGRRNKEFGRQVAGNGSKSPATCRPNGDGEKEGNGEEDKLEAVLKLSRQGATERRNAAATEREFLATVLEQCGFQLVHGNYVPANGLCFYHSTLLAQGECDWWKLDTARSCRDVLYVWMAEHKDKWEKCFEQNHGDSTEATPLQVQQAEYLKAAQENGDNQWAEAIEIFAMARQQDVDIIILSTFAIVYVGGDNEARVSILRPAEVQEEEIPANARGLMKQYLDFNQASKKDLYIYALLSLHSGAKGQNQASPHYVPALSKDLPPEKQAKTQQGKLVPFVKGKGGEGGHRVLRELAKTRARGRGDAEGGGGDPRASTSPPQPLLSSLPPPNPSSQPFSHCPPASFPSSDDVQEGWITSLCTHTGLGKEKILAFVHSANLPDGCENPEFYCKLAEYCEELTKFSDLWHILGADSMTLNHYLSYYDWTELRSWAAQVVGGGGEGGRELEREGRRGRDEGGGGSAPAAGEDEALIEDEARIDSLSTHTGLGKEKILAFEQSANLPGGRENPQFFCKLAEYCKELTTFVVPWQVLYTTSMTLNDFLSSHSWEEVRSMAMQCQAAASSSAGSAASSSATVLPLGDCKTADDVLGHYDWATTHAQRPNGIGSQVQASASEFQWVQQVVSEQGQAALMCFRFPQPSKPPSRAFPTSCYIPVGGCKDCKGGCCGEVVWTAAAVLFDVAGVLREGAETARASLATSHVQGTSSATTSDHVECLLQVE